MQTRLGLIVTACLSCCLAPATGASLFAADAARKGVYIEGHAGAVLTSGAGGTVLIHTKPGSVAVEPAPGHQVILDHKPVTLVPVATIPSYSISDKISRLWSGISDSIGSKIKAVGNFFRGPPRVLLIHANTPATTTTTTTTTTQKPHKPPVIFEIVAEVPQHRVYSVPVPVLEDCDKK